MIGQQLVDLDELVLKCRSDQARAYIAEAVACYKAGAFRSCIVATWVAVVYDYIDKLRQLDLTGDKEAAKELAEFERKRVDHDVSFSLIFERTMLVLQR
jgi:hypothetical protein